MDKKHRERGDNWTSEEKELLVEIMRQSSNVIENKNTDTNSNKLKNAEWLKVEKKFQELSGKNRHVSQLKGVWRRIKMNAKKSVFQHKKWMRATGGGRVPPSPSDEDKIIMEICPSDFILEENSYDDGIFVKDESEDGEAMDDTNVNEVKVEQTLSSALNSIRPNILKKIENVPKSQELLCEKEKCNKTEPIPQATPFEADLDIKERTMKLLEEEYALKIKYRTQELNHQKIKHNLEIELLMLDKQKKELEIAALKKC